MTQLPFQKKINIKRFREAPGKTQEVLQYFLKYDLLYGCCENQKGKMFFHTNRNFLTKNVLGKNKYNSDLILGISF